jgi:catechol 2,3-dioxygenase-like lactoylglutathione lyase family enzyme
MAFYFQDPDRHNLEIIYFPNGKGDPKWQRTSEKLFLGIDHSAIGINKTTISANFYENLLGLKTVGHSENYGSEQEHLNQIFGAHLLISGLRAKQGIGIEFLEYLSPPGGKSYPSDSKPTDIWHWHTTIKVNDIDELYNQLLQANTTFISKGIVSLNNRKQFIVRDNDGHAILLIE